MAKKPIKQILLGALATMATALMMSAGNLAHAFDNNGLPQQRFDMDGDGRPETFSVSVNRQNEVTLTIARPSRPAIIVRNIVASLEEPSLVQVGNSLRLNSSWVGIGRYKWESFITIAYRRGHYMVGGYYYSMWDSLDPEGGGSCELNLFTGRGTINGGASRRHRETARDISAWRGHMPAICQPPEN